MNRNRGALMLVAALLSSGCVSVRYLSQAASGQVALLTAARPIPAVVRDPETPARLRQLLSRVPEIKAFGLAEGLKPTRNYRRYADLKRPAAVWIVQACPDLAFEPKRWRFPIVGSVPYLGFFDLEAARRYAHSMELEGLDVDVRGASAYSTLGWFEDAVLSTMISDGDEALGELANTVLHESVHATLYVKGQSAFDESLASFVADRLTRVWLRYAVGEDSPEARAYREREARAERYRRRMHALYQGLDTLYRSAQPRPEKLREKARLIAAASAELGTRRRINNASLAGFRTYETGSEAFERLLTACDGDWRRFMQTLAPLQERDFDRPQQRDFGPVIDRLVKAGCAPSTFGTTSWPGRS